MSSQHYQLTKHPVGSLRELMAIAWPLAIAFASTNLMIFVDRLLLAWYEPIALNAGANAGLVYYMFLIIPMSIAGISEVMVGRLRGEERLESTGLPVWQMIWFSLLSAPLFWMAAYWLPPLVFYGTGNEVYETAYFQPLLLFAPIACINVALSGFFIGIGNTRTVTFCMVAANVFNVVLAYLLIFGIGPLPSLGVAGASIAMGLAQLFQMLLLMTFFLSKEYRTTHGTSSIAYEPFYFWESLRIGSPAGLGHGVELLAHCIFFRIVMQAGHDQLSIVAAIQSLYIAMAVLIEAQSKAVSAIISNLLGASELGLIDKVFKTAIKFHTFLTFPLAIALLSFPGAFLSLFFGESATVQLMEAAYLALFWMCLFFLFDGFNWILVGHFTAAGDTKFLMYISCTMNWIGYVLPTFLLVGSGKGGADSAWMVLALYTAFNFMLYGWRYHSGRWLGEVAPQQPLLLKTE